MTGGSPGRPRASSPETLAEAACELFLERGYAEVTVSDIAARAGLSRSSFFNYFSSKTDILWAALDERVAALTAELAAGAALRASLERVAADFEPDHLALAIVNAEAMGIADELAREAALRQRQIAASVARRLTGAGLPALVAEVAAAAHARAVLAAIDQWARAGAGATSLAATLGEALDVAQATLPGTSGGSLA